MTPKGMFKMAALAAVSAVVLAAGPARGGAVEITDLQPFSHVAYIPVSAVLSSIKFESVKAVKVAETRTSTANKGCEGGVQETGGSMYCPHTQDGPLTPAYRITYSYSAPPMASDEHGNTHFTFSVNLRPEELNPAMLQAIAARKVSREAVAENLKLTTSRGSIQRTVIDTATSTLCDGNYSDGVWTHTNPNCQDRVNYMTVTLPSDYIAVRVDLASSPLRSDAAEAH